MRNEVLHTGKEERTILHTVNKKMKVNWIGHVLRMKCLLQHVSERKITGNDIGERKTGKKK